MEFIRSSLRFAMTVLFRFAVLAFPLVTATAILFSSPSFIQSTIKDSGVYNTITGAALAQAEKDAGKQGNSEQSNPLKDPEVQKAIKDSVDPGALENAVTQITNGTYAWLQGKTDKPQFRVDLTPTKEALVTNLSRYAEKRAASLPTCTPEQLAQQGTEQKDFLSITCLPPEFSPQQVGAQFGEQAFNQIGFLQDPIITGDDVFKDSNAQVTTTGIEQLPAAYQNAMLLPWLFGLWIVIFGAAMVLLHAKRRRGVQIIGTAFLVSGLLYLVVSLTFILLFSNANFAPARADLPPEFQLAAAKLAGQFLEGYAKIVAIIAAIYTVIGVAVAIIERRTRSKTLVAPPADTAQPKHDELPPPASPATTDSTKHPKDRISS